MKSTLILLLSLLFLSGRVIAQDTDQEKEKPFLVILTGIGVQWFDVGRKLTSLSIERPLNANVHFGLQGSYYFPKSADYYGFLMHDNGFEAGLYLKYFLHGRFSGRKSGLYLGPEIRFGKQKFRYVNDIFFPLPPSPDMIQGSSTDFKLAFRWGIQRQIGHAVLELACPIGVAFVQSDYEQAYENGGKFIMMPLFQLGYAF
ncbi:MAG TPA: hypothetical protein DCF33_05930 [Saprospirales bacterium]|nr:hypothetical protein [Saprospirales bacterium]